MKVKIFADSSCDLPARKISQHDITIVPLYVILDDKSYKDMIEISPNDIFDHFEKTRHTPQTASPNVYDFVSSFQPFLEDGREIVYIGISDKSSASVRNALLAKEELGTQNIHVVDSQNFAFGGSLMVLRAAEMAESGCTAAEIVTEMNRIAPLVHTSFITDSLDFLHKGGRCSALQLLGANLLQIKPTIVVSAGIPIAGPRYRGAMIDCVRKYVGDVISHMKRPDPSHIFLAYSRVAKELIALERKMIEGLGVFKEILEEHVGCVIASHAGAGAVGIMYLEQA